MVRFARSLLHPEKALAGPTSPIFALQASKGRSWKGPAGKSAAAAKRIQFDIWLIEGVSYE
jgi:hypothetical protein